MFRQIRESEGLAIDTVDENQKACDVVEAKHGMAITAFLIEAKTSQFGRALPISIEQCFH